MLVSSIERIGSVDPLAVLERLIGRALVDDRIATLIEQGRAYWARPRDAFAIAAIGAATTLHPAGTDRFAAVDESWRSLMSDAVIEGADADRGVGPLLVGGFAFDPEGPRTSTWSGFPSLHFILPRITITSINGESFVTVNGHDRDDNASVLAAVRPDIQSRSSAFEEEALGSKLQIQALRSDTKWKSAVSDAVERIRSGELEKVVLARAELASSDSDFDVFATLRHLKSMHRDSFVFGYWRGEKAFVGASPERLARVEGRDVEVSSLAGTIPRGSNEREDLENASALKASAKDRAEHAAVRNALYQCLTEECETVATPAEPALLTLPHVHHLHTEISGRLREGRSLLDIVRRLHPSPAVGGSPREPALEFIRENEGLDRGWYAAPIGWIGRNGGEFAVALRSAVIDGADATLFAGCGIVADSDPDQELAESTLKLQLMESALAVSVVPDPAELTSVADRAN
jgi:isochorismate synthase